MQVHGENNLKAAVILMEVSKAYTRSEGYSRAIQHMEHSSLILQKLNQIERLDEAHIHLIDIYLSVEKMPEFESVLLSLENRLEQRSE